MLLLWHAALLGHAVLPALAPDHAGNNIVKLCTLDLSQINDKEELTLIDFPQMVSVSHPNAKV